MRPSRGLTIALALLTTATATATALPPARAAVGSTDSTSRFSPPHAALVATSTPAEHGPGYHADLMHFTVHVGPGNATTCDIVGELFRPNDASPAKQVPVILTTNGFGGSYTDQQSLARYFVRNGYDVLTYSGLGFGGSGCAIELDSPEWDGAAASQLISYLGQQPETQKDGPDDPRVGMVGGSYGGAIQFATAAIDPRLDTIVPVITWNDLVYSLGPNNNAADFVHNDVEPGVEKLDWTTLFFADGLAQPASHKTLVPALGTGCPGFDPAICQSYAASAALGYVTRSTTDLLRHNSMVGYGGGVRIPVMLMQGEGDSLFNINEAIANYRLLQSLGDTVKLVLQSWGHSKSTPAPGEVSYTSTSDGYETLLIQNWFAKYLKHAPVSTGPSVEYFRDWVGYDHHGSAGPAYGTASTWPVGSSMHLYLSGNGALVANPASVTAGRQSFVNPGAGLSTSYSETSGVQGTAPFSSLAASDVPGTFASWATPPLAAALDSVGIPVVRFRLSTTSPAGLDPLTDPVVFGKLYDVAPDGSTTLVQRLVSPIRVTDEQQPVTLTLPGVVHRYAAGHRIELVLAATDLAYLGSRVPNVLTVTADPAHPTALDLPVVRAGDEDAGGARTTGG